MLRYAIALVLLGTSAWPVAAQGEDNQCNELLIGVEKQLASVMLNIESVPPSDAAYLGRELKAAITTHNEHRFNAATRNDFYHAFRVHEAYEPVAQILRQARNTASVFDRINLGVEALKEMAELTETIHAYTNTVRFRVIHPKGQAPDVISNMTFSLAAARTVLASLIKCNVQLMILKPH